MCQNTHNFACQFSVQVFLGKSLWDFSTHSRIEAGKKREDGSWEGGARLFFRQQLKAFFKNLPPPQKKKKRTAGNRAKNCDLVWYPQIDLPQGANIAINIYEYWLCK